MNTHVNFGIHNVSNGGLSGEPLWASWNGVCADLWSGEIRAVVSLDSDVELTPNGEHSWTLSTNS